MIIQAAQLQRYLSPLRPLYFISGDEPLLVQEALDQVRLAAAQQSYSEREIFIINKQFNWQDFMTSCDNLSLFASKRIIELRCTQKLTTDGQQTLMNYCSRANEQVVVLISMPKLEASSKSTKWFKTLEQTGICLQIWPIDNQQLPHWLQQRLQAKQLYADPDVIQLISDRVEGNLLAAQQEIEKLALLFPAATTITAEQITQVTGASYRYDVFALVDLCLQRKTGQINKALISLRQEGTEATLVLWALTREVRTLIQMIEHMRNGATVEATLQKLHVWEKRKPLLRHYFQHCKKNTFYRQLQLASIIDQQIKGIQSGDPWENLLILSLNLAGERINSCQF